MSLRIASPSPDGRARRGPAGQELEPDFYMSRLIKLLPAEAVAVYPLLKNRAQSVVDDVNQETARRTTDNSTQLTATPGAADFSAETDVIPDIATTAATNSEHWLMIAIAWLVLVVVILLRWQATRDANGNAQWGAVAIAAISFILWVPTMQGSFGIFELAQTLAGAQWPEPVVKFIPEVLLIFWALLVPAFYKPQG